MPVMSLDAGAEPTVSMLFGFATFILGLHLALAGGLYAIGALCRDDHDVLQSAGPGLSRLQLLRDIFWSIPTCLIFAFAILFLPELKQGMPFLNLYFDPAAQGWIWFGLSVLFGVLLHDFYMYWLHRFLHLPAVFEVGHALRHGSTPNTPFGAIACDPGEAFLAAFGLVLIAAVIPISSQGLILVAAIYFIANLLRHAGEAIFPRHWAIHSVSNDMKLPTHHTQHHQAGHGHYGLYTLIWDRLFGTLHLDTNKRGARADSRRAARFVGVQNDF